MGSTDAERTGSMTSTTTSSIIRPNTLNTLCTYLENEPCPMQVLLLYTSSTRSMSSIDSTHTADNLSTPRHPYTRNDFCSNARSKHHRLQIRVSTIFATSQLRRPFHIANASVSDFDGACFGDTFVATTSLQRGGRTPITHGYYQGINREYSYGITYGGTVHVTFTFR